MSAATKVTIAVVVLFAALLGVYYGFGGPGGGFAPADELPPAEDGPGAVVTADEAAPETPGMLGTSVEQAIGGDESGPGVLASDGLLPAVERRPAPPADEWVIGPPPAYPPAVRRAELPQPAGEQQYTSYVVQEGDSMWTIADQLLKDPSRWGLIAEANPTIDPNRLQVGQRIRVPQGTPAGQPRLNAPASVDKAPSAPRQAPAAATYTVRAGDTLSSIAQAHYRDASRWRAIWEANRATIGWDPDRLKVGMRLRIPPA
jgi:nucleoid-associated protein YgaU